ncbi:MAG: hypothetical protein V1733_09725 [bacterium]
MHNLINELYTLPLGEYYSRLPVGFYYQFTEKAGFPLLLGVLALNSVMIRIKFRNDEGKRIIGLLKWMCIFMLIYIVLLPLGGYRIYRPNVLRYDTVMPVTICLMFLFGLSTYFLINNLSKSIFKTFYVIAIAAVLLVFTRADEPRFRENACEKQALRELAQSQDSIVFLTQNCPVMSWNKILDYKDSEQNAELLNYWGVTKAKKLYYQQE